MSIKHLWSILCKTGIIDARTNNVSLIQLADSITFHLPRIPTNPQNYVVDFEHWSQWFNDSDEEAEFEIQLAYMDTSGISSDPIKKKLKLQSHASHRWYAKINVIPVAHEGIAYWILKYKQKGDSDWHVASQLPLLVKFKEEPDAEILAMNKPVKD